MMTCFLQCRTKCQIEYGSTDHSNDGVDTGSYGADLGKSLGNILRHTQQIHFIEVTNQRIRYHVKCHTAGRSKDRYAGHIFYGMLFAQMEDLVSNQSYDQTNTQF